MLIRYDESSTVFREFNPICKDKHNKSEQFCYFLLKDSVTWYKTTKFLPKSGMNNFNHKTVEQTNVLSLSGTILEYESMVANE